MTEIKVDAIVYMILSDLGFDKSQFKEGREYLEPILKRTIEAFQESLFQDSDKIIEKVWNEGKCFEDVSWKYRSAMNLDPEAIHKPELVKFAKQVIERIKGERT